MRRPLFWVTLCYLGGLAAGEVALYLPVTTLLALAGGGTIILLVCWRGAPYTHTAPLIGALVLSFGVFTSHLTLTALEHSPLNEWRDRGMIGLTGQVRGLPQLEPDRTVVLLDLDAVEPATAANDPSLQRPALPAHGRVRLNVRRQAGEDTAVRAGDRLHVTAELRRPYGLHNVGLFDAGRYAHRQGIDAAASVRTDQLTRLGEGDGLLDRGVLRPVEAWRERIDAAMAGSLPAPSAALLSALILGETGRITSDMRDTFTAAGVAHLLSISGSHLALLAGVIFLLVRGLCRLLPERWLLRLTIRLTPTQLATLATVPAVIWYTALSGGQTATIRSLLMLLLYCGAVLLSRPHDLLSALAIAAFAVLIVDPLALGTISFQLSYGAVLGMALALAWWSGRQAETRQEASDDDQPALSARWRSWLQRGQLYLLLTAAATAATAPLVLYHFRQFSWVGLVSNLVVPAIGVVVIPLGLLSAGLTLFFSLSTLPLASLNDWAVTVLRTTVSWFARWPGAVVHLAAPSLLTVVTLYIVMAALVWGRRFRWLGRLGVAVCVFWVAVALAGLMRPGGQLRVSFLDVGQGDGAVVAFPTGQAMVIDGGPQYGGYDTGRAVVAPYLWDHGIRRIDYLVASHPQADHIGGQTALLRLFPVDEVWHNGAHREGTVAGAWEAAATGYAGRMTTIRTADQPVRIGSVDIDLLHPTDLFVPGQDNPDGHGLNDSAIVLRIGLGEHHFLFTGDIERPAESELVRAQAGRLEATVLKVPHHGSRTSSTPDFLDAVRPEQAVISVGVYNPYHHPSSPVLEAYEAHDIELLRTDQEGEVVYLTDGTTLRRFTARELELKPVLQLRGVLEEEWANYRRLWVRWWWRV
ncbi:MAG TPA: DNA internalization-related competence protein ComEC/Rec2 [Nitrospiria bacterium]|nr:DNA internalization-related competence protein ComEC/Rec2 [Nitrospiria bacterium]